MTMISQGDTMARPRDVAGSEGQWTLIDVRTPGEFREAHIEGSRNIPLGSARRFEDEVRELASAGKTAIVCRTGQRAREAARIWTEAGIENLAILDGGVVSWAADGLALIRGEKGMSIERQVRIAAGLLVLCGVALGWFVHPWWLGLSAFVGAGLVFAGLTDTCGMAFLLAKLPWNTKPASCSRE